VALITSANFIEIRSVFLQSERKNIRRRTDRRRDRSRELCKT